MGGRAREQREAKDRDGVEDYRRREPLRALSPFPRGRAAEGTPSPSPFPRFPRPSASPAPFLPLRSLSPSRSPGAYLLDNQHVFGRLVPVQLPVAQGARRFPPVRRRQVQLRAVKVVGSTRDPPRRRRCAGRQHPVPRPPLRPSPVQNNELAVRPRRTDKATMRTFRPRSRARVQLPCLDRLPRCPRAPQHDRRQCQRRC